MKNRSKFCQLSNFLLLFVIILSGCIFSKPKATTRHPLDQTTFSGRLLFRYLDFESKTEKAYEISQGVQPKLVWDLKNKWGGVFPMVVSPGHSYASYVEDGGYFVNLLDNQITNIHDPLLTHYSRLLFSPDDKYLVRKNSNQELSIQKLSTMETNTLVKPHCASYGEFGGFNLCLEMPQVYWLDEQTLIFLNDIAGNSESSEFPEGIIEGGPNTFNSGKGYEVLTVDLTGKVSHLSDDPKLIKLLEDGIQSHGDIVLCAKEGIWLNKKELKQGIYNPHKIPDPEQKNPIFLNAVLSPKGHYYLRFPVDIVDLVTGKTIPLGLDSQFLYSASKNGFFGDIQYFYYQNNHIMDPSGCFWNLDEKQIVCEFNIKFDSEHQLYANEKGRAAIIFLSTTGTAPILATLSSPAADLLSLDGWLP